MSAKIEQLIINSPYNEPLYYWQYNKEEKKFYKVSGRRRAGYLVASQNARGFDDDAGKFIDIPLVNQIRPKIKEWRESNYPGITNITRKLLNHWHDKDARKFPFFFCQLDAIETLIWLKESNEGRRLIIQDDGSKFRRLCTKLCTGGGKTIVMAMLIAWQVCNKARDLRNMNYSRNILIAAPNLTVKKRLQVLRPGGYDNYYEKFDILPVEIRELINQARVIIHNWQALAWEDSETIAKRKDVDKRGPLTDSAYARKILGRSGDNWLVINDEAHHAYRIPYKKKLTDEEREATIWIQGLDRIHEARKILTCYDFSATPFIPGSSTSQENLFSWIISDFSLSDGIESGLVKTPRVVVRDSTIPDPDTYKSRLFHLYTEDGVKDDLTIKSNSESLPDLVRSAYQTLASDWKEVFKQWQEAGKKIPPVMITVANNTRTAERIEKFFASKDLLLPEELCESDKILRIDSKKLEDSASSEGEILREKVDTVGQVDKPGEQLRNIISVGMLSEGWDAKTVTQIMGLRAFSSQLLCEQVVGRGLRRTSYDRLNDGEFFAPEYVNVFGVPFTFLPHEETTTGGGVIPTTPTTEIKALDERREYKITWPNVTGFEYISGQKLSLDLESIKPLELKADDTIISAEIAPILDGQTDLTRVSEIDLERAAESFRLQQIIFHAAANVFEELSASWKEKGSKLLLLGQVINLVQEYLQSDSINITPKLFAFNRPRKKILYAMNMSRIIKNLWDSIRSENTEKFNPVYDTLKPVLSTGDMPRWWTARPNHLTRKSHINNCVYDSTWEASTAYALDRNSHVQAWAKNDHLGFSVYYLYNGERKKYLPDFLIRLDNGKNLILEIKGKESAQDKAKKEALKIWVEAVNDAKNFGEWACDVSYNPEIGRAV